VNNLSCKVVTVLGFAYKCSFIIDFYVNNLSCKVVGGLGFACKCSSFLEFIYLDLEL